MPRKASAPVLLLVAAAALVVRCGKPNQKPVFDSVTWPDSMYLGATTTFSCVVSDPDGDSVTVGWTCSMGTLSAPTGTSVTWQAPDTACGPLITVRAVDTHDEETRLEHTVTVTAAPNRPPRIDSISGPDSIPASAYAAITCNASDPDGDSLTFTWTCTRGRVSPDSGRTITWYAPDTSGDVIVMATARDGRGGEDSLARTIRVTRLTTILIDTEVTVAPLSYKAWYATLKAGYSVLGYFGVDQKQSDDALDINFYIMDSTNYHLWVDNQPCWPLVSKERYIGSYYSAIVPRTCRYYIVLDNTYSLLTPKTVWFNTLLTSP